MSFWSDLFSKKKKMFLSKNGLALIQEFEKLKLTVYLDQGKKPTIGYGHLLTSSEIKDHCLYINGQQVPCGGGIDEEVAEALLRQDIGTVEEAVKNHVKVKLNQNQHDVLCSFIFNVGQGNFLKSTLLTLLNSGDYDSIPSELKRWNKVTLKGAKKPITSAGLTRRRAREAELWVNIDAT